MTREEVIQRALQDVARRRYRSYRAAAKAHNLPKSTLTDRAKSTQTRRKARESQQILSSEQEDLLVRWILELERTGNAPNHEQLRQMAALVSVISGGVGVIGKNWVPRFLQRHPEVHTKRGVTIAAERVRDITSASLSSWFDNLRKLILERKIQPANIWNVDETGNALGVCSNQTVVGSSGKKRTFVRRPQNREWVSVIECISTGGRSTTPLVIFKGKSVQLQWFDPQKTPNWYYESSPNAYTSNEIAVKWLRDVFIPETVPEGGTKEYRLLLLDGHSSHVTTEFMWEAYQNNILVYYLIPHTSHFTQPLDLAVFSSMKRSYRAAVATDTDVDDDTPVKKQRFLEYYQRARTRSITPLNCASGFAAAGIEPWNPRRVLRSSFIMSDVIDSDKSSPSARKALTSKDKLISTPKSRKQLQKSVITLSSSANIDRSTRTLFTKAGVALDRMSFSLAIAQKKINVLERKYERIKAKSAKKASVNPNETFVNIEDIRRVSLSTRATSGASTIPVPQATISPTPGHDRSTSIDPFIAVSQRLSTISAINQ